MTPGRTYSPSIDTLACSKAEISSQYCSQIKPMSSSKLQFIKPAHLNTHSLLLKLVQTEHVICKFNLKGMAPRSHHPKSKQLWRQVAPGSKPWKLL